MTSKAYHTQNKAVNIILYLFRDIEGEKCMENFRRIWVVFVFIHWFLRFFWWKDCMAENTVLQYNVVRKRNLNVNGVSLV